MKRSRREGRFWSGAECVRGSKEQQASRGKQLHNSESARFRKSVKVSEGA